VNIAVDATLLGFENPTGIAVSFSHVLGELIHNPKPSAGMERDDYTLNYFAWHSWAPARTKIEHEWGTGCTLKRCAWLPYRGYKLLERLAHFPYRWLFGSQADVSLFYYHDLPPGVAGKKVVVIHDMVYKACPETMEEKTRLMHHRSLAKTCKRADMIVTVSQFSKSEIMQYMAVPAEKIRVMYNGVDQKRFSPDISPAEVENLRNKLCLPVQYFLYVGTLEPRKNLVRLIQAYHLLREQAPDKAPVPDLVIAGGKGWHYDDIFAQVRALGLAEYVHFTDYVDDADLPALMRGCFAFLFPSTYEGFGIPPLEAMACGAPVLTSNVASLPEVVGDDAVLVNPSSVESITKGLRLLITDASLRQSLASRGPIRARAFTWKAAADTLRDVFQEVTALPPSHTE